MRKKLEKINPLITFAAAALLFILWAAFLRPVSSGLAVNITQNSDLKSRLAAADEQIEALRREVQTKLQDITLDREEILNKISISSEKFNLSIDRLKAGEITASGGLKSMTVQLEVSGFLSGISDFFNEICPEESGNSVNGFSLRRSGSLPWLARRTDDERPLDWWSLELPDEKTEPQPIELADLIGSGKMRCFAEITFVGGAQNADIQ